jgi:lysine 2,3-aminomutase
MSSGTERFQKAPRGPWADVPDDRWNDWHWQMQNRIRDLDSLRRVVRVTGEEAAAAEAGKDLFRIAITPYYAALIDPDDPGCPCRLQAVPRMGEVEADEWDLDDPLAEERDMPTRGITHRYPDRALLYVTPDCAMFCRHCTRKRKVSDPATATTPADIGAAIDYVRGHPEVRDVIVSGGDPLTFSDDRLEEIVAAIRAIPHVEIIRVGTRVPVTMPQRITPALVAMLRKYHPIYVNTHFNHPKECTAEAFEACRLLADAGIPIGNQSVLLRGVNDSGETFKALNRLLLMMRVKPYYIYQCDLAKGNRHFRTRIEVGLQIMRELRGWTSGLAVPYFVVDSPGGGGKIPLLPDSVVARDDSKVVLKNFRGTLHTYPEPRD